MKNRIICFIPARSGSKRIKNKNIKILNGQPLLFWTFKSAIKSNIFDKIIFSTDSIKYYKILLQALNKKRLSTKKILLDLRSKKNSSSKKKIFDYIKNNFSNSKLINKEDLLVQLLPTAPLRKVNTILSAIRLAKKTKKNIFSVNRYDFHISFALKLFKNNTWKALFKNSPLLTGKTRSQDQKEFLKPNPVVNCVWVNKIHKRTKSIYSNALAIKTDYIESLDVDDKNDFFIVKSIMEK